MKSMIIAIAMSVFLSLFASFNVSAQESGTKEFNNSKFEVNIAVSNVFARNNYLYDYYYYDPNGLLIFSYYFGNYYPKPQFMAGLKIHSNKGAFRLGTLLNTTSLKYDDNHSNIVTYNNKGFDLQLNLGYEWEKTYKRVEAYYGFDLSGTTQKVNLKEEETDYNGNVQTTERKIDELAFGVSPLLGVNYFITPHLSVGTEFKFTAEYLTGKIKMTDTSYPDESTEDKISGFRTHFGPLGFISVNVHF